MLNSKFWLHILGIILISTGPVFAQSKETIKSAPDPILRINNIYIDKINKTVLIKTRLAIKEGILEYLLVGEQGKTYESVFKVAENKPSELNFALLLIGAEPLDFRIFQELLQKPDGLKELLERYKKSLVEIDVYRKGQGIERNQVMKNRESSTDPLIWVFTGGSFVEGNRYAGDYELSHIGIWPDPTAVINLFSKLQNPYGGKFGFEINQENKTLSVDQDFEVVIRRFSR